MYALLDGIQPNERCFEPELDSGLMNEEKRNASLTTRALTKGFRIESGGTDIHYMKCGSVV